MTSQKKGTPAITWPEGKAFAFTVFDDTDAATLDNVRCVYDCLRDCGFRTTKSCWPVAGDLGAGQHPGQTCDDAEYLEWLRGLQSAGFEIGWHGATWHGVPREITASALEKFADIFGHDPSAATNHAQSEECMYWGSYRLTGWRKVAYDLITRFRNHNKFRGHLEGDEHFWGDLCKERITYFRNFVFRDINTLKSCPFMPYHDPRRPYVNYWFASSDGASLGSFNKCISEKSQDRLEEEGGACIMYTHFARRFSDGKSLDPTFQRLITRLSKKNGWFVPVGTLLDHLQKARGHVEISDAQRRHLEKKWLLEKIYLGAN